MFDTSLERSPARAVNAAPLLAGAAVVIAMVQPRATPLALAALAGLGLALGGRAGGLRSVLARSPVIWALGLLVAWSAASVAWTADPFETPMKTALLASYAVALVIGGHAIRTATTREFPAVARSVLIAFAASLAYLVVEELTGHGIKTLFFTLLPGAKPTPKHIVVDGIGGTLALSAYISNRNMALMVLLSWPVLLIARRWLAAPMNLLAPVVAGVAILLATLTSAHESSVLGVAASAIVFVIALRLPRCAVAVVGAGWLIATLAVVPIANHAFWTVELHKASWLPISARHRIVLWAYTADQVANRPLTGIGSAATKLVDAKRGPEVAPAPGTIFEWRSKPHPHNIYLQVWYELGAIGALLFAALGVTLLAGIARLPAALLPYPLATMTAASVIGASTWGLWQAWFLGAFAVAALVCVLALRLAATGGTPSSPRLAD